GVYVTHMRRSDPAGGLDSMEEVFRIGREAGVPVHISLFTSQAALVLPKVDEARARGVDVTYDLYCYLAGSSILAMQALPPSVQEGGITVTLARLSDTQVRSELREWFKAPRVPLELIRLSYVQAEEYRKYEGCLLPDAIRASGQDATDFVCDLLVASGMAAGCIAGHRHRGEEDVQALMRHAAMMAGSDGIFSGSRPHPRG